MVKGLSEPEPIEKHIILLKLTELMEERPEFGVKYVADPDSPQRRWLQKVRGVIQRLPMSTVMQFDASMHTCVQYWSAAIPQIQSFVYEVIEGLKVDLEIDGRADIGTAFAPGDVYRFFADLQGIVRSAGSELFIIDPYFDGVAFDEYLGVTGKGILIRILARQFAPEVSTFAKKHAAQHGSTVEVRHGGKKIHDRVIFVDQSNCWIVGGSIKDAARKAPTYLIPLAAPIVEDKLDIYEGIWSESRAIS